MNDAGETRSFLPISLFRFTRADIIVSNQWLRVCVDAETAVSSLHCRRSAAYAAAGHADRAGRSGLDVDGHRRHDDGGRQADSALAIGAVSLGSTLYYVVAIFGTGLMLGLDTLVSHSYGAGDLEDAHRSLVNGVYLSLALAPVLMGVVWVWGPLLRSLKIQESLLAQAVPYLHALNWSTLPLLFYFVFRRYLQGINLAKPVMFSLLTANLINVLGNWALIYGHLGFRAMGTVGPGWATCVGRVYMAMVLLVYCIYYDLRYKTGLREASKRVHLPRVWKLMSLGFPAATQLGLK